MIELSSPIILDGNCHGVVIGRGFDLLRESAVYDVRFSTDEIMLGVVPERLRIVGPCRRDVIGRDIPHNPKRAHLFESESERKAA